MKRMEGFPTLALCALAALTLGCGEKDGEETGHEHSAEDTAADDSGAADDTSAADDSSVQTLSYAADVESIFTSNCAPCHTSNTSGGLSLAQGAGHGNLVNQTANSNITLVVPNDSPGSYLWRKLEGSHNDVQGGGGDQMPKNAPPLSQEDMGVIDNWIRTGANP